MIQILVGSFLLIIGLILLNIVVHAAIDFVRWLWAATTDGLVERIVFYGLVLGSISTFLIAAYFVGYWALG